MSAAEGSRRPGRLADEEVDTALGGLSGWERQGDQLVKTYGEADFDAAIALVGEVADLARTMDHHPDIDIRWNRVTLRLSTHDAGGLTRLDLDFAARLDGTR